MSEPDDSLRVSDAERDAALRVLGERHQQDLAHRQAVVAAGDALGRIRPATASQAAPMVSACRVCGLPLASRIVTTAW